jgi:chitinase
LNITKDFGIAIWIKNGAPAHKLVLGIPLFARTFLLARRDQNELHSPTIGNGTEGPFTRSAGFLSYFEVNLSYKKLIFILFDIKRFVYYNPILNG